jgi:glycosyltransferase involved in cell wall biosynthesis
MNILFLDQFSDLGGAQRCLIELLPALRDRGWRSCVAAPGSGPLREHVLARGGEFRQIRCGPYRSGSKSVQDVFHFAKELPALAREIAAAAREFCADIIYVNGPRLLPAASLASRGLAPLVFHCHSYLRRRYAAALAGISLDAARATVIASCRFVAGPLRLYVPSSRIEVVYNGVESSQAYPANGALPSEWRVGVVGRIAPEKGQLEFLQAARLLPPNCRFVICGSPLFANPTASAYFDHLRESANGLPVEFLGWQDDVGAVLSHLHLLVVPSAPDEGTTRVILEAYAAGVPVVAMNSGGIPEIVSDGETGLLAPAGDPAKLAAKIREGLDRPASLARLAQNARLAWRDRYTLGRYQTRILSILERVGASARA